MTRVLVVEDSLVSRELLVHLLESDPGIQVVGVASNGEEALDAVQRLHPDVITMDIHMPKMDGLEATRRIMENKPTPIVIVSGSTPHSEAASTFATMDAGALAILPRPQGVGHPEHESSARKLIQTVKLMAEVKVVRRWARSRRPAQPLEKPVVPPQHGRLQIVGLGASTGGPPVLRSILAGLPKDFPLPIVMVQHMSEGFLPSFCDWLSQSSGYPVKIASHWERALPGHAYLAPDHHHLLVTSGGQLVLNSAPSENGMRPAVSVLFRSLAQAYGASAVAGLLTGMGRDGAVELKQLRDSGAVTFAQDQASSIVHGMAGEAIRLDAASMVLPQEKVAQVLVRLAKAGDESRFRS
ncbi:MAG: chemotaxis-specific protein-glutamate methyltransferase CheB [Trueperaceae bacterium]